MRPEVYLSCCIYLKLGPVLPSLDFASRGSYRATWRVLLVAMDGSDGGRRRERGRWARPEKGLTPSNSIRIIVIPRREFPWRSGVGILLFCCVWFLRVACINSSL